MNRSARDTKRYFANGVIYALGSCAARSMSWKKKLLLSQHMQSKWRKTVT